MKIHPVYIYWNNDRTETNIAGTIKLLLAERGSSVGCDAGCQSRVVSSNRSFAYILSDVWQKSLWQASFVFHQWTNSLCEKATSCLKRLLCLVQVWDSQETHGKVIWSPWYDRKLFKMALTKASYSQIWSNYTLTKLAHQAIKCFSTLW